MYTPPAFRIEERAEIHAMMRACRLATLVAATEEGLMATPLPLVLAEDEGDHGVLYGHLARANPQWQKPVLGEAMVLFSGPDAYITPSWYETKRETGKVVPTWNYGAVHAYGPVEFFDDPERLRDAVTRLTQLHESGRAEPWAVSDAPEAFVAAQLRGIVGLRLPITRLAAKLKMSQNRPAADRRGVAEGLAASERAGDRAVAALVPVEG
jgi:transcriptional regulator